MKLGVKLGLGTMGSIISFYLGGWDTMLQVLVTITVLDYITGLLAGAYEGNLSSKVGYRGIIKKVMMFCVIALSVGVDNAFDAEIIHHAVTAFYIGNEGLSILENAMRADVKFPQKLKTILEDILEDKHGGGK